MEGIPWILIIVALLLLLLGAAFFLLFKNKKRPPPDYYTLFITGIIWLAAGLPLGNTPLTAMGAVLAVVGLLNKDKWEKNRRRWEDLDEDEKRFKLILIAALGLLVLLGAVAFLLVENGTVQL